MSANRTHTELVLMWTAAIGIDAYWCLLWNFHSQELSFPGAKVPYRNMELSLSEAKMSGNFCSRERKCRCGPIRTLQGTNRPMHIGNETSINFKLYLNWFWLRAKVPRLILSLERKFHRILHYNPYTGTWTGVAIRWAMSLWSHDQLIEWALTLTLNPNLRYCWSCDHAHRLDFPHVSD